MQTGYANFGLSLTLASTSNTACCATVRMHGSAYSETVGFRSALFLLLIVHKGVYFLTTFSYVVALHANSLQYYCDIAVFQSHSPLYLLLLLLYVYMHCDWV